MKKRLLSAMLVLSMTAAMFTGCSSKKVTVEDVMKNVSQNSMEFAKAADDAIADNKLSYDELTNLVSKIPEGTVTIGIDAKAGADMTQNDQTQSMSGNVNGNIVVDMDCSDMELGINVSVGYGYDAMGMNGSQNITTKLWLVKEAEGYYMYTQQGVGTAQREYLGNLEEVFGDGIDISEYTEQLGGMSFVGSIEESTAENSSNDAYKNMTLDKDTIDYNGRKCYQISMNVTGDQTVDILRNNEEYTKSVEAELGMTFEEMLTTKIMGDMTYGEILNACEFSAKYYITTDDYTVAYCGIDMRTMIENLVERMVPAVLEGMGAPDMQFNVSVENCNMYYTFDKADTDVKFEGDYKDAN